MPGSDGQVLKNLLNITAKSDIDRVETELLYQVTDQLLDELDRKRRFSTEDIKQIHNRWLGPTLKSENKICCIYIQL